MFKLMYTRDNNSRKLYCHNDALCLVYQDFFFMRVEIMKIKLNLYIFSLKKDM
jgi:hypothetical protein